MYKKCSEIIYVDKPSEESSSEESSFILFATTGTAFASCFLISSSYEIIKKCLKIFLYWKYT